MSLEEVSKRVADLFQQWQELQPLREEYKEQFDKKVRLDWNYNSNRIEGNTLSYNETESLLIEGKEEGIHPPRDYMEIKAHDLAINKIREYANDKERNLTESDIRGLNKIILKEPFWKEAVTEDGQKTQKEIIPGKYKTQPNRVKRESGEIFKFVEPQDVPTQMAALVEWTNEKIPLLVNDTNGAVIRFLAELHHRFIYIHPFDDGNGRIARLWMNYVLLRLDYPPLVIKDEDKRNYFAALERADRGDMDTFAIYLGGILVSWLETGIRAANGENIIDIDDKIKAFVYERVTRIKPKIGVSPDAVRDIYQKVVSPLYGAYIGEFAQFNKLFTSTGIEFSTQYLEDERSRLTQRTTVNDWNVDEQGRVDEIINLIQLSVFDVVSHEMYLFYKGYMYQERTNAPPFDMKVDILWVMGEFQYNLMFRMEDIIYESIEKKYSEYLSKEEMTGFIRQMKEVFFEQIQSLER